jgi:NADH-quinone oxidoreductase subunit E
MSVRRLAEEQPERFAFTPDNVAWARREIAKYPPGRQASAVLSLLWRAQEQEGWVSEPAIRAIAEMLDMATIRVLEVATFYTMFHLEPVGGVAHIQVCGTTPCWLRGANDLKEVCRRRIGAPDHPSADGRFSWEEVECLGACVNAPMVQIGADTYEDLTADNFEKLIDDLAAGRPLTPGPQIDRQFSAPVGGPTTLTVEAVEKAPPPVADREAAVAAPKATSDGEVAFAEADRPEALAGPRGGQADDLKRIKGVGPKIERLLNDLGVYHYDQVAAWTDATVAWVDDHLKFRGRIGREAWIAQAKTLAKKD